MANSRAQPSARSITEGMQEFCVACYHAVALRAQRGRTRERRGNEPERERREAPAAREQGAQQKAGSEAPACAPRAAGAKRKRAEGERARSDCAPERSPLRAAYEGAIFRARVFLCAALRAQPTRARFFAPECVVCLWFLSRACARVYAGIREGNSLQCLWE